MKKPKYALAIELRRLNPELDVKFKALPDKLKWQWLEFATNNRAVASLREAWRLVMQHEGSING